VKRAFTQRMHKSLFKNESNESANSSTTQEANETDSTNSNVEDEELGSMANVFEAINQHLSQLELNMSITASYVEKVISSRLEALEKRFKISKDNSKLDKIRDEDLETVIVSLKASLNKLETEVMIGSVHIYNMIILLIFVVVAQFLYCCLKLKLSGVEHSEIVLRNASVQTNLRTKSKRKKDITETVGGSPNKLFRANSSPELIALVSPQFEQKADFVKKDLNFEREHPVSVSPNEVNVPRVHKSKEITEKRKWS